MSLQGKVALVTGGAQGIGRAMVQSLLEEGASVAICDRSRQHGEEAVAELSSNFPGKCTFLHCDVTNHHQLEECFKTTLKKFQGLDIVVNNAGIINEKDPGWKDAIQINLVAVISGTRLGVKYMGRAGGGKGGTVVNVGSDRAFNMLPHVPVYIATKAAVNYFSFLMGSELHFRASGVRVLCLNPAATLTPLGLTTPDGIPEDLHDSLLQAAQLLPALQSPESLGKALLEVLRKAESGSLWIAEEDRLPVRVQLGGLRSAL